MAKQIGSPACGIDDCSYVVDFTLGGVAICITAAAATTAIHDADSGLSRKQVRYLEPAPMVIERPADDYERATPTDPKVGDAHTVGRYRCLDPAACAHG